jgi:dockerin type I repeat protein/PEP-CTERM motif-containing protein
MNRFWLLLGAVVCVTIFAIGARRADADDPLLHFRFVPSKTSVHVTGGPNDYDLNLTISGLFGFQTSGIFTAHPTAKFVDVHGILYNPLSAAPLPVPGWDLDQTLNMSGWNGTFVTSDLMHINFLGVDGAGVAMLVQATWSGRWLQLLGQSSDPIGPDPVLYQFNAMAHRLPFADFNNDGRLTGADLTMMQQALADPQAYEAAHFLTADDFTALADANGDGVVNNGDLQAMIKTLKTGESFGAIPEPSALVLLALGGAGLLIRRKAA